MNHSFKIVFSTLIVLCASLSVRVTSAEELPNYSEHQDLSYYLDATGAKHSVNTKADWQIRRKHILDHMQNVMGPLPKPKEPVPLNVKKNETRKIPFTIKAGNEFQTKYFTRHKITYHTDSPNRTVSAYLFLPPTDGKKVPAILCLHQTTKIGKMEPAGLGGKPNLRYALHLAKRGYVTLAPDYPSFGDYDYDFDPKFGYISGTMKAIYDNVRAVDVLQSLDQVDREIVGNVVHQGETVLKRIRVEYLVVTMHQLLGEGDAKAHNRTTAHLPRG